MPVLATSLKTMDICMCGAVLLGLMWGRYGDQRAPRAQLVLSVLQAWQERRGQVGREEALARPGRQGRREPQDRPSMPPPLPRAWYSSPATSAVQPMHRQCRVSLPRQMPPTPSTTSRLLPRAPTTGCRVPTQQAYRQWCKQPRASQPIYLRCAMQPVKCPSRC